MKWLAAFGVVWLSVSAVLALQQPDGINLLGWTLLGIVVVWVGLVVLTRGPVGRRMAAATGAAVLVGLLGFNGSAMGSQVHFRRERARYSAEATKQSALCLAAGRRCRTVGVPDERDSGFVFVYDPDHVGAAEWRLHSEAPNRCTRVDPDWVHCVVS